MDERFEVAVGAGILMSASAAAIRFPHRWTPDGVTVEGILFYPLDWTPG